MSIPHLPPETFDYIIDLLHDESPTLKECCLVSKSWIPRTRRHLFAYVQFRRVCNLNSWKETFPDPAKSPAYHTHTLTVGCVQFVEEADAEEGGWIQTFSRVERLIVNYPWIDFYPTGISLTPFRKFSSTLKSLRITSLLPLSQVFNLIYSLPLLEDLALTGRDTATLNDDELDAPPTAAPLTPPAVTGTLELRVFLGVTNTTRRLLDLPNGLHFRKLNLSWYEKDLQWMTRLVVACAGTLEYLDTTYHSVGEPCPGPIDLSKASKLKDIMLRCENFCNEWVAKTLETITSKHRDLQQITIYLYIWNPSAHEDGGTLEEIVDINTGTRWLDVDRLLVKFWDSRSIRSKVVYVPEMENEEEETRDRVGKLFPELAKRGMIYLVDYSSED